MKVAVWGHPYREFPVGRDRPSDVHDAFGRMREAGIDIYIPFVLSGGRHYYESALLGPPERDLLGPCLEAGRAHGVEVHPITGLGEVGAAATEAGRLYDPAPAEEQLPSWSRQWPCAAWEENRRFTCEAAEELLKTYRPNGLHMDYMRYPNTSVLDQHPCRCVRCQEERQKWLGKPLPTLEDLARPGVVYLEVRMRNRFVKSLVQGLHEATRRFGVPLSLAARARYLKDAVAEGQDWVEWCREGLLDFICPMSYNPCFERFQQFVQEHTHLLAGSNTPLYCGIGRKSSLGTITAQQMAEQIAYALDHGADGVCIFHLAAFEEEDYHALKEVVARYR